MSRRRQRAPRSLWILLILVVAVAGVLIWSSRRGGPTGEHVRGGPLLEVPADRIESVLLTNRTGQYRFDRSDDGVWSLGGAVSDYVAQNRMQTLLEALVTARGGPVIPGSEPEDRRYGFNASAAVRVTVGTTDGRSHRLALGTVNPVTGRYYASGVGRNASFTVDADLRNRLVALPASVQLDILLPLDDRDRVTGLELDLRSAGYRLQRQDDRWWIRPTAPGAPLSSLVADYQRHYDDRRLRDVHGLWYAADFVQVDGLIYDVSALVVRDIPPLAEAGALRIETGLDRPAWHVALLGEGIDPDPLGGDPDRLELSLAFGTVSGVPVLRRQNLLLVDAGVLRTLNLGPDHLFDVRGLPFRLATADSLHLDGPDGPVIWAAPTADGWRSYPPPGYAFSDSTRRTGHEAAELVTDLDRLTTLTVLPPTGDRRVLSDDQRLRLTAWFDDAPPATVEFGLLAPERLSAGSELVDFIEDELPAAGIWSPDNGASAAGTGLRDHHRSQLPRQLSRCGLSVSRDCGVSSVRPARSSAARPRWRPRRSRARARSPAP